MNKKRTLDCKWWDCWWLTRWMISQLFSTRWVIRSRGKPKKFYREEREHSHLSSDIHYLRPTSAVANSVGKRIDIYMYVYVKRIRNAGGMLDWRGEGGEGQGRWRRRGKQVKTVLQEWEDDAGSQLAILIGRKMDDNKTLFYRKNRCEETAERRKEEEEGTCK